MIDRLNKILLHLGELPTETQGLVATYIEVLIETLERNTIARGHSPIEESWKDPVGAWSDLPDMKEQRSFSP